MQPKSRTEELLAFMSMGVRDESGDIKGERGARPFLVLWLLMMARMYCQRSTETWTFGTREVILTLPAFTVPSRGLNRAAPLTVTVSGRRINGPLPRLPENKR